MTVPPSVQTPPIGVPVNTTALSKENAQKIANQITAELGPLNKNVVFKDALMSLTLKQPYIKQKDVYSVFIFRNPIGFYFSLKRFGAPKWAIIELRYLIIITIFNNPADKGNHYTVQ